MKSFTEINSLLNTLTINQLKDIQNDIKKLKNDSRIYYVADTFDIINYTLPFTDRHINIDSPNYLSQTTIAYETIFSNNNLFNFSLPDEYKYELIAIKNNLDIKLHNFPSIRRDLLEKIESDSQEEYEKLLKENIELLTVVFIFASLGNNVYKRFNEFLKTNLNISSFKSSNKNNEFIVNQTFSDIKQSPLTSKLFNDFVEKNKLKLLSYSNELERYCYLDNTYRDIIVVDRLFNINKILNKKNIYFHYLSSAPIKTNKIFESLKKIKQKEYYSFNRNIMQLFLLNYILEKKLTEQQALKHIDYLIEIKSTEQLINNETKESMQLLELASSINKTFSNYRQVVEKSHFYDSYKKFKKEIEKAIKDLKIKNNKSKILAILKKIENVEHRFTSDIINDNFYSLKQLFYLSFKFSPSKIHQRHFSINPGKDIIRNTFHHLPLLPFLYNKNNSLIDAFYNLINTISNEPKIIGITTNKFFDLLTLVISEIGKIPSVRTMSHHNTLLIILSYLNILTDNINEINNDIESEIILVLEKSLNLEKNYSIRSNIDSKNEMLKVETKSELSYSYDIGYMLIWLYRRQEMYNKAEKLSKRLLKINDNDARIHQGLALTYHSLAYKKINSDLDTANKYFKLSYTEFEKAYDLYFNYTPKSKTENTLIIKQQIAILNALIDNNLRRYELNISNSNNNNLLIYESRYFLNHLKDILSDLPYLTSNYNTLETINHTESELEYYEALQYYNKDDLINALHKINMSTERINNFINSNVLVPEYFKSIVSKVNKLRIKIYKKLNYF